LGVVPNGLINDFANFWGLRSKAPEAALERLLHGRTMRVDVGEVRMMTLTGEALRRYFLNCVNVGLVADVVKQTRRNHSLWKGMRLLRDLTSALMLMIARPAARMEYRINGQSYSRVHTAFCIGSATGFGQTPSAVPYNGQFDVSAVKRPTLLHVFTALSLLLNRRFLSQKGISVWRTPAVEISHVGGARVSVDGHAIHRRIASLNAKIHPSMIRFLIP
ncbi:MAG: lipid kinase, partial [Bacteroidaceae bacterium]|nr:lipid kinase [Bacteroidaceae bacterium]